MNNRLFSFIIAAGFAVIFGQGDIDLAGQVINQAGTPLEGFAVTLQGTGMTAVTDEEGMFSLSGMAVSANKPSHRAFSPVIEDGYLTFTLTGDRVPVDIRTYNVRGERTGVLLNEVLRGGEHSIPLAVDRPAMQTSLFFLVVSLNGKITTFKVIQLDGRRYSVLGSEEGVSGFLAKRSYRLQAAGTLVLREEGVNGAPSYSVELSNLINTDLTITLDILPELIILLAMAEKDRYPDEVGQELDFYPYDIARYLDKTGSGVHDYEAWCSEFVSWAYIAAGFPLTDGWDEEWMIGGSTSLRSWFRANTEWVSKDGSDEWYAFVPAPGDYIRYDNDWGGHSGIVRYQEGTTLYTVEGNVGNRVRTRTLDNWKDRSDVDGIGRRSGYIPDGASISETAPKPPPAGVYPKAAHTEG